MTFNQAIVHIVDDDASFRSAIMRLLHAAKYQVRCYATMSDFMASDALSTPGCILLDLQLDGASGFDLQRGLEHAEERLPIVFLTGKGDIPSSVRAMKGGAVDFLTKPVERERLLSAVELALERDASERKARARRRELRARYDSLTAREREVFAHVVGGKLNKQTAFDLGASERTIKAHRASVMGKLGAQSVAELARIARDLDIEPIQ